MCARTPFGSFVRIGLNSFSRIVSNTFGFEYLWVRIPLVRIPLVRIPLTVLPDPDGVEREGDVAGWLSPEQAAMVRRFRPAGEADTNGFFVAAFEKLGEG